MPDSETRTLGEDGLFKLLTWNSLALTRLFGLPEIAGEPIQQEFQFPTERRVDRLYRLADGSMLNIEHQSRLGDREALARRMVVYNVMIRERFPDASLLQVVVYTGREPADRSRLGDALRFDSLDARDRHGVRFSAALCDFRTAPIQEFRRSGRLDDLILGLMASGGDDDAYIVEVVERIRLSDGEVKIDAIEKFTAVCATMPDRKIGQWRPGDRQMWASMEESAFVRDLVEVVGAKRIESARNEGRDEGRNEGQRLGLARLIVLHAQRRGFRLPASEDETIARLAAEASEDKLLEMAERLQEMSDFGPFLRQFGIDPNRPAA